MATIKQTRAFKNIMKNSEENLGKAMVKAGYSRTVAENPKNLTESKGFIQLLDQAGLTDEYLNTCLREDIEKKPQNRKQELELAYKLRGRTEKDNDVDPVVNIQIINY